MDSLLSSRAFDHYLNEDSFKHIGYNYSQSEVGLRHPNGPVGVICRDQGQLDTYAGLSRHILQTDGIIYSQTKDHIINTESFNVFVKDISQFLINNKYFSPNYFSRLKTITSPKEKYKDAFVTLKDFQVDPETGIPIRGFVPITDIFSQEDLFINKQVKSISALKSELLSDALGL